LLVALLVFGPQRLPEVGRQVGAAMRELRKIQDTVRGEMDMVLNPEHGTRSAHAPEEPGDHTYGDHDEHVVYGEGGYVGNGNGVVGQEDLANGLSDFTPPDYRPPDPNALDAPDSAPADTDPGFRGPPDSFI
jgi:TatA/E family protein of Tat protein translocase